MLIFSTYVTKLSTIVEGVSLLVEMPLSRFESDLWPTLIFALDGVEIGHLLLEANA